MTALLVSIALLVLISPVAFALMWWDKRAAINGRARVPESTLHLVELAGGWPGSLVAQRLFRHKTVKTSYRAVFWLIVTMYVGGTIAAARWLG